MDRFPYFRAAMRSAWPGASFFPQHRLGLWAGGTLTVVATATVSSLAARVEDPTFWQLVFPGLIAFAIGAAATLVFTYAAGLLSVPYRMWEREEKLHCAILADYNNLIRERLQWPADILALWAEMLSCGSQDPGHGFNGHWIVETIAAHTHTALHAGVSAMDITRHKNSEAGELQRLRGLPVTEDRTAVDDVREAAEVMHKMVKLGVLSCALLAQWNAPQEPRFFLTPRGLEVWRWALIQAPALREIPTSIG